MIVPTRHLRLSATLLASGGLVLNTLSRPMTISTLWDKLAPGADIGGLDGLLLSLDFLYIVGAVELSDDGQLRRLPS